MYFNLLLLYIKLNYINLKYSYQYLYSVILYFIIICSDDDNNNDLEMYFMCNNIDLILYTMEKNVWF